MSDAGTREKRKFSLEEKLEATYDRLKITSIFFCIGWFLFSVSWLGLFALNSALGGILTLIGWVIATGPLLIRMWAGGFKGAFNMPEYEVITTYADGRKESDGGVESAATNLIAQLILAGVMLLIGSIATLIYLVYLSIRYLVLHARVKSRPAFMQSGLLFIVLNIAFFAGGIAVGAVIQKAYFAARHAQTVKWESSINALIGQKVPLRGNTGLWDGKDWARPFKQLNKGDIVTVKSGDEGGYTLVEHEGDTGKVNSSFLVEKP